MSTKHMHVMMSNVISISRTLCAIYFSIFILQVFLHSQIGPFWGILPIERVFLLV